MESQDLSKISCCKKKTTLTPYSQTKKKLSSLVNYRVDLRQFKETLLIVGLLEGNTNKLKMELIKQYYPFKHN